MFGAQKVFKSGVLLSYSLGKDIEHFIICEIVFLRSFTRID